MKRMEISAVRVKEKPKYSLMAGELLERCREFYQDPDNEEAFREWKAGKEGKRDLVCCG